MDAFSREALSRLPLAEAALTLLWYVADDATLDELFERHRGTGSEREVRFALLVELVVGALLHHQGSGRQSFQQARDAKRLAAGNEAVYGKLRRVPLELSEAVVRETTRRLRQVLPADRTSDVPPALRDYQVLIVDGKKLKRLPKRLKALRGAGGKLLGGKVVAGLLLNEGLIVAMEASPDGEANDAPLTPALLEQCEAEPPALRLYVADRQFCDLTIPRRIVELGQSFLIRYSKKMLFFAENEQILHDAQGRVVRDAQGWLGRPGDPRRMQLRQVTLERGDEEPIVLVTNLLDAEQIPAEALLETYLARWTIERVFQQVAEVFHLERLVSTSPQGAIFQFALCSLLYNLIQAIRGYVAQAHDRPARSLSSEMLFRSVCDQLAAYAVILPAEPLAATLPKLLTPDDVRARLHELLARAWSSLWIKAKPKKKRPPPITRPLPGGHASAWKLINEAKNQAR